MKISKLQTDKIAERIGEGENFTSIAKEYGVTPWAIQKRFGKLKPKRNVKIWEIAPDVISICEKLAKKYYYYGTNEIYDFVFDSSLALTANEEKNVKKHGEGFLYWTLERKIWKNRKNKKDTSLYFLENGKIAQRAR